MKISRFLVVFFALVALAAAGYSAATTTKAKAKATDDCCADCSDADGSCCSK